MQDSLQNIEEKNEKDHPVFDEAWVQSKTNAVEDSFKLPVKQHISKIEVTMEQLFVF